MEKERKWKMRVTIFTPTYNRRKQLKRLYMSLCEQTFQDFEWLIVDDGSEDNTGEDVEKWIDEKKINIRYHYQENNGKHIAMNWAVNNARGNYFITMDSDDVFRVDGVEKLVKIWKSIPDENKKLFSTVKARCFDPTTGNSVGKDVPQEHHICSYLDAKYKYKFDSEMVSMTRIEVLKEFPNPDIRGGAQHGGLRFYPEGIWQDLAARKYQTFFINDLLCGYTQDNSESLLGRGKKYNRYRENIYLWPHVVNDNLDYFRYDPKSFIKAFIGISMDGFFLKMNIRNMLKLVNGFWRKGVTLCFVPIGYFCYIKRR